MTDPTLPSNSNPSVPARILVFGCGYLGQRVAENAIIAGHQVFATTRSQAKANRLQDGGIEPILADWTDGRTLCRLPPADKILIAVAYDRHNRHSRYESQVGGLRQLLASIAPDAHVCYISTTGVYHQTDGSWVDECAPTFPNREGGRVHLQAESLLHRRRPNSPTTILRLSGIYGPGRVPRAADVIAGRPIASPATGFLNLIHVDDAAAAVASAWETERRGLYVVSDDQPVIRGHFYQEIAKQTGAPEPHFVSPNPGAPVRMRSDSNKRIWNRKFKRDLVARLRFPTYREGLASVLRDMA
ncbi:MAG: NAD-dependent epimerase/dehydratase family protein [Rubripirellula sp.]